MGQMTYALCYGIQDRKIKGFDAEVAIEQYYAARAKCEIHFNAEGTPFIGIFIAAGASGMVGVPDMKAFCLLDVDKAFEKRLKTAANAWTKFSHWCAARGITLPVPQLWLIECEVA